jgi:uncharacterized membrane protein
VKTTGDQGRRGSGRVARSLTIDALAQELLSLWRDPQVQARLMAPVAKQVSGDGQHMRWRVPLPMDRSVEVETRELSRTDDSVSHETSTLGDTEISLTTTFSVRAAPAEFGTEALLTVDYALPGGILADAAVRLAGPGPELMVGKALRRLKALVETGEIPSLQANPSARGRGDAK